MMKRVWLLLMILCLTPGILAGTVCGIDDELPLVPVGHVYSSDADTTCNICGHVREVKLPALLGDADGSETVDFFDGMLVLQYYAGTIGPAQLDLSVSDVDNSGSIDFFDGMYILQYYAGVLEQLPV